MKPQDQWVGPRGCPGVLGVLRGTCVPESGGELARRESAQ